MGEAREIANLSLRGRAVLAVALTVAFYGLAIAIGGALIAVPIALFATSGQGNVWIALAMMGAGLAVLRAIIPERDRFEAPGPPLHREEHPELHAELDEVARAADQAPADEIYLDLDVNAAVLERRRRRIMVLGLPLMATLERDELRAVIAHELGHLAAGDTRFGAWIWRTRVAVLKTVQRLGASESWFRRNVVRWPFQWYALLFLRVTNAVSRRQEFAADALSARVTSPEVAGRALRRVSAAAPAFDGFWRSDVVPMLEAERLPALAQGFQTLVAHADVRAGLDDVVQADLAVREPDPYASHPSLRERLAALGQPAEANAPPPAVEPASNLLRHPAELEQRLLTGRLGDEIAAFAAADWHEAGDVHLRRAKETVQRFGGGLPADATVADAAHLAQDVPARRERLRAELDEADRDAPDNALDDLALEVLASRVVIAAHAAGCEVDALPGDPVTVCRGERRLAVWRALAQIVAGEDEPGSWREQSAALGIAGASLAVAEASLSA